MGGVDLSFLSCRCSKYVIVPARVGGVDLSLSGGRFLPWVCVVPARVGGVDLSESRSAPFSRFSVPARVGGVDLSTYQACRVAQLVVPARVGGVDLSLNYLEQMGPEGGPRPCGRGGFKLLPSRLDQLLLRSPPVWAGWI